MENIRGTEKYIADGGIDASRIATKGHGKHKPISKGTTDEARGQNRRVEMIVVQ